MTLKDIQFIFNRALSKSFNLKKNLLVFAFLALCGVLVVFFSRSFGQCGAMAVDEFSFSAHFSLRGSLIVTRNFFDPHLS